MNASWSLGFVFNSLSFRILYAIWWLGLVFKSNVLSVGIGRNMKITIDQTRLINRVREEVSTYDTLLNFPFLQYVKYDLPVIGCSEFVLKGIPAGFIMHPLRPMSVRFQGSISRYPTVSLEGSHY